MPKFFNARDLDFIKTIAEEVVDYVVEQAVTLFKVSVGETKTNLYGESLGKVWRAPSTLMCIVDREPINIVYEGFGADKQGTVEFRFNIQRIRETSYAVPKVRDINGTLIPTEAIQNVEVGYPEIGDVILYDGIYYELDNVREPQWIGGSPEIYDKESNKFEDASNQLIATAIMVRRSQVQIEDRTY
tara:strand:- start:162 stop:722 length:561 start_codon:yes stop_codon:yes gene_type:complete